MSTADPVAEKSDETSSIKNEVLRIWVDAQLPPALARWLHAEFGADATHVEDLGLLREKDPAIFAAARAGIQVVVLTKDDDFLRLLQQNGPPPQVVWVRCGNVKNSELRRIVIAAWPRAAALLAAGEVLVELRRIPDGREADAVGPLV